jgi:hypothetical protein
MYLACYRHIHVYVAKMGLDCSTAHRDAILKAGESVPGLPQFETRRATVQAESQAGYERHREFMSDNANS